MNRAAVWAVAAVGSLLGAGSAAACSCDSAPTADAARARATLVFAGRVEEVRRFEQAPDDTGWGPWGDRTARVVVSRIWKGPDLDEVVVLTTDSSACGVDLYRGDEWLLYASGDAHDGYAVHGCDRSTRYVDSEAARLGVPIASRVLPPLVPTPLERALTARDVGAVRAAIAGGADVNDLVEGGRPVQLAVTRCAAGIVDVLRDAGARGLHDPERALRCPNAVAMVRALGADREEWGAQLGRAAAAGDLGTVTTLLDAGVDPNRAYRQGGTALARALSGGHTDLIALLCARGAVFDRRALAAATESQDPAIRARVVQADLTSDDAEVLRSTDPELPVVEPLLDPGSVVAVEGCDGEVWRSVDLTGIPVARTGSGYRIVDDEAECASDE